jgi:hypothetical protein
VSHILVEFTQSLLPHVQVEDTYVEKLLERRRLPVFHKPVVRQHLQPTTAYNQVSVHLERLYKYATK